LGGLNRQWYPGVDNLKRIKNHLLGCFIALEIHRTSALENIQWMKANLPPLTGKPSQKTRHDKHLHIEQYDSAIKQVCNNFERFQVHCKTAIRNQSFAVICVYVQLQKLSAMSLINNCYRVKRNLFTQVIAGFNWYFHADFGASKPRNSDRHQCVTSSEFKMFRRRNIFLLESCDCNNSYR